ncbi:Transcription cofactor HES-6 [Tupaia chinensis]|uniref:Transcription cofactor HES-6 n=1 Tax=Tupaia chinensis TaxID=246437 RepID=L9KM45_TUPCH|nr:Transcription cofactor HES-6 [Tupaia chinensis]
MAPPLAPGRDRAGRDEDSWEARGDRKARKPLVEKKRRARINESLQELRLLLAGAEVRGPSRDCWSGGRGGSRNVGPAHRPSSPVQVQAKLENAEVLELTVRRVQGVLRGRTRALAAHLHVRTGRREQSPTRAAIYGAQTRPAVQEEQVSRRARRRY